MSQELLYLGLDVHSQSISIALAEPGGGEVRNHGTISGCLHSLEKTLTKIKRAHPGRKLKVCYEAGPTGFVIARRLAQLKIECLVAAPTLIPNRSGDRVKTDARDALKLARLLRAGCTNQKLRPRASPHPPIQPGGTRTKEHHHRQRTIRGHGSGAALPVIQSTRTLCDQHTARSANSRA